ncbi:MAG: hypothetical protein ACWA5U_10455 [bacterium]
MTLRKSVILQASKWYSFCTIKSRIISVIDLTRVNKVVCYPKKQWVR